MPVSTSSKGTQQWSQPPSECQGLLCLCASSIPFWAQTHSLDPALGHDKAQSIIDQITASYESTGGPPPGGFGFGPQHLGAPPPNFGPPPGFGGPMPPPMISGGTWW